MSLVVAVGVVQLECNKWNEYQQKAPTRQHNPPALPEQAGTSSEPFA